LAYLPYVASPGNIEKSLNAIKAASVPDSVSQDFVKTVLKIPGGSGDQIATFLKKIGFSASDGSPTEWYTKFRNPTSSGQTVALAIKHAYRPLYVRNEYMHELSDDDLLGLIVEETGKPHDAGPVKLTLSCIKALKKFADFSDSTVDQAEVSDKASSKNVMFNAEQKTHHAAGSPPSNGIGLNLGYTININLPATTEQAVFNAIFKSLKENLLRDEDG